MALGFSSSNPVDCSLYLGPLEYNHIKNLNVELENIMNFGWFFIKPISHGVLYLLTSMHKFVPNYGVLLIIFSVLVKILVYPLTKKSYHSTKEMQAIQPLIMELREKYKGDPQRLNKETMKLYKEHGVNPLGGCLPMLLQMPLLFALFIVFRTTIELRGAPFVLWIKDLSAPDTILELPFTIPIYGSQVSVLPILMGVSMFIQQKTMGTQATGQQKYMSYFMTVFFLLLFNNFPSGLNLYYTLFNVLTILQQKYLVHPHTPAITPTRTTRSKKK
jgi:YidC/Oxa1 family membrane protein insertase